MIIRLGITNKETLIDHASKAWLWPASQSGVEIGVGVAIGSGIGFYIY